MVSHFGVCAGTEQSCVAMTRVVLCCCFPLHRPWSFPTSSMRLFLRRSSLQLISLSVFMEARCSVSRHSWNKENCVQRKSCYLLARQRLLWFCLLVYLFRWFPFLGYENTFYSVLLVNIHDCFHYCEGNNSSKAPGDSVCALIHFKSGGNTVSDGRRDIECVCGLAWSSECRHSVF